jgi:hypothetical protein
MQKPVFNPEHLANAALRASRQFLAKAHELNSVKGAAKTGKKSGNKYSPHQGESEKARRRRQIAKGMLKVG